MRVLQDEFLALASDALGDTPTCLSWDGWRQHRLLFPSCAELYIYLYEDAQFRRPTASQEGIVGPTPAAQ